MQSVRAIPFLLLVLVLSACNGTSPKKIGTQQSSSFSEQSSSSSLEIDENAYRGVDEEQPVLLVWHTIESWTPTVPWSPPEEGTNAEIIIDDALNTIPPGAMKSASIEASIDQATFNSVFMEMSSRNDLDATLRQEGWVRHPSIDADGPLGTNWGYRREAAEGKRFLIVSVFCADRSDNPSLPCPSRKAMVTVTAAMHPENDQ